MKFKILNEKYKTKIEYTIIYLLLESREAVYLDGKKATWSWDINNPYYCEAFGMLRSLEIMGYGSLKGEVTLKAPQDLKEWFQ